MATFAAEEPTSKRLVAASAVGASDLKAGDERDYRKNMPLHHRIGWLMFVASAVLFGISGVRSGDVPVMIGSAVFGVACLAFLKS